MAKKRGSWGISRKTKARAARSRARSNKTSAVRREYHASKARTRALGRHLGQLTGAHKSKKTRSRKSR